MMFRLNLNFENKVKKKKTISSVGAARKFWCFRNIILANSFTRNGNFVS